mmetsp:Transcript_23955/g.26596  ORF Transcript_23955/g.26596 Transcript_23955/m.26596 type:complete len:88 (-) Transcript_23955:48-311(-)
MNPDNYIDFIDNSSGDDLCEFWIGSISVSLGDSFVLMGDSFLREYYIYHDAANEKVGFYGKTADYSKISTTSIFMLFFVTVLFSVTI